MLSATLQLDIGRLYYCYECSVVLKCSKKLIRLYLAYLLSYLLLFCITESNAAGGFQCIAWRRMTMTLFRLHAVSIELHSAFLWGLRSVRDDRSGHRVQWRSIEDGYKRRLGHVMNGFTSGSRSRATTILIIEDWLYSTSRFQCCLLIKGITTID